MWDLYCFAEEEILNVVGNVAIYISLRLKHLIVMKNFFCNEEEDIVDVKMFFP